MNKIANFFESELFKKILVLVNIIVSLGFLDIGINIFNVGFRASNTGSAILFMFSYVFLFMGIFLIIPKRKTKLIFYGILIVIFNLITYSQYLHFRILNRFYTFADLFLAKEGSNYFLDALKKTDFKIILILLISILSSLVVIFVGRDIKDFCKKKSKKYYIKIILLFVILVVGFRTLAIWNLGEKVPDNAWDGAMVPRNIYDSYADSNKSLEVSGLYEFIFRGIYLYYSDMFAIDEDKLSGELDDYYKDKDNTLVSNEYTGIFEGDNVIIILMESVDSWLVTEEYMPTLYKIKNEGINFVNRYSPFFGGAQTINSEFALNTGLYVPSKGKGIFNYSNTYSTSLANMFINNGYSAISVHANTGNFYNRSVFHKRLGYTEHNALFDREDLGASSGLYFYDSNLMRDEVYEMIVRDDKFLSFITTYSTHLPYDISNGICDDKNNLYDQSVPYEHYCIDNMSAETDKMVELLIERLEEDGKLEDTVLVFVTDHYMYGFPDTEFLYKVKGTDNQYLLQNTPFIIWKDGIEHEDILKYVDTADILPTLFNMFGIEYNPNYYSGEDIFSSDRDDYIYFSSDIYYDKDGLHSLNNEVTLEEQKIFASINEKININNKIIYSDYFGE